MNILLNSFSISTGYLLGSIPFGKIIAKSIYHVNIQDFGSKNPGATNVWRVLGWKPGLTTLILDMAKGAAPVLLANHLTHGSAQVAILSGLASIIGHNWSIFLTGKGGKGVATSAGVFFALIPIETSIALLAFLTFFLISKHVSVGSIASAAALLLASLMRSNPTIINATVILASTMVLIKHVPNMKRLKKGEEPKVPIWNKKP